MIAWPPELVSDLARRRSVLFLGAGISRNSTNASGRSPRTWVEFLKHAAAKLPSVPRHVKKMLAEGDLLTTCEVLKNNLGRDSFNSTLIDEYLAPGYQPSAIHDTLFKLDARIVATPNFDKIYESHANHKAGGSVRVKHQYDTDIAEAVRRNDRLVLKVHGSIDTPDRMIFTRAEYAEARSRYRGFYAVLEALALTHTFLFLGCGINDPDVRLLLEDMFFRYPNARPHIFVLPNNALHADLVAIVQSTMNVRILTYNPAGGHSQLLTGLDDLLLRVETEREELRRSMNW